MAKTHTFTSNGITVEYEDNSQEVLDALRNAVERGLMVVGEKAVGYAQDRCPADTGQLKESITYQVEGDDCYIGTNVEYGKYVEFGTGVYSDLGGRQTPWSYQDGQGNWHRTSGMKPKPFIKPAASEHGEEYLNILRESLQNA